ncbi:MAG: hypothetical protein GY820_40100 [Gammaproteobacteria bacterium]|nr:hypothetical protein [Gammaproteobacteria bacterium]
MKARRGNKDEVLKQGTSQPLIKKVGDMAVLHEVHLLESHVEKRTLWYLKSEREGYCSSKKCRASVKANPKMEMMMYALG